MYDNLIKNKSYHNIAKDTMKSVFRRIGEMKWHIIVLVFTSKSFSTSTEYKINFTTQSCNYLRC